MKQAKASDEEAKALLRWLIEQDQEKFMHPELRPPAYARTVHGYLLLKEHCTDPAKDYLDWKPGYAPAVTDALRKSLRELVDAMRRYEADAESERPQAHREMMERAMDALSSANDGDVGRAGNEPSTTQKP